MEWHEAARTASYAAIVPAFVFFGIVHYNSGEYWAALVLGGLSTFFLMLMAGLVLVTYFRPVNEVLLFNTGVVVTMAVMSVIAAMQYVSRKRRFNRRLHGIDDAISEIENARQGRLPGGA